MTIAAACRTCGTSRWTMPGSVTRVVRRSRRRHRPSTSTEFSTRRSAARDAWSTSSVLPASGRADCAGGGRDWPPIAGWTSSRPYCESHATDVPFHAVARLIARRLGESRASTPRLPARVYGPQVPDADPEDILLLDDLLGIADADRRRSRSSSRRASTATDRVDQRGDPGAHDACALRDRGRALDRRGQRIHDRRLHLPSSRKASRVLITYRPEYQGVLSRVAGAQTLALRPLSRFARLAR